MNESTSSGPILCFDEIQSSDTEDVNKLKELDNFLKCAICYEYFNTCVVTDCSHNFCSLCIRKYIQFKTECPVCFAELYDSQLRANRLVDNFVSILPQLKDRLIRRIRTLKTLKPNTIYLSPSKPVDRTPVITPNSKKRKITLKNEETSVEKETPAVILEQACNSQKPSHSTSSSPFLNKVVIPPIFQSPVKKGTTTPKSTSSTVVTVQCPICTIDIPERNINVHLDVCLERQQNAPEKRNANKVNKRTHLPKLVVRLMSTSALRAKAREYGLNAHGDIETLKNRIQKFTVLYNAECDKVNPRPIPEIIRQLEKEEKVLSQKLPRSFFSTSDSSVSKEKLNEQYLKENKNSYAQLIKNLRHPKTEKKTSDSDDADVTDVKPTNSLSMNFDHIGPSTSKSFLRTFCHSDVVNGIDIEEIKEEPVDGNLDLGENEDNDDNESTNSEELFPVPKNRFKRIKRLNFEDSESSEELRTTEIPFVDVNKDDSDDPVFDAMTDEDIDFDITAHAKSNDEQDNLLNQSPVLVRRPRRKRKDDEESVAVRKSLRKKKKMIYRELPIQTNFINSRNFMKNTNFSTYSYL